MPTLLDRMLGRLSGLVTPEQEQDLKTYYKQLGADMKRYRIRYEQTVTYELLVTSASEAAAREAAQRELEEGDDCGSEYSTTDPAITEVFEIT